MFVNNGRYAGGKIPITPIAVMNDGLLDLAYFNG
jgi:hypothetical protein